MQGDVEGCGKLGVIGDAGMGMGVGAFVCVCVKREVASRL